MILCAIEWSELDYVCLMSIMGSESLLDLILFYFLTPSNPLDASETWQWICIPTGAHSVDPAAECLDADSDAKDDSNDDYVDEAGTDIMESSSDENF